ncbi:MAG: hypothetical protein DRH10_01060 [Deltaproteobacteria bacterium]|nr:MAG: hypothetical protein DRH10_01060 [Deltaproteobacteria bacterium]
MSVIYDLAAGLDMLVPSAKYQGSLKYNTEQEYGEIVWLDGRKKPSYEESIEASLNVMRLTISEEINEKTRDKIIMGFKFSVSPETQINSDMEWQFDVLNLWLQKDSGLIVYPYSLYASFSANAKPNYITIADSAMLQQIYFEMFGHVDGWLRSGRTEKDKLTGMTKDELEEYIDKR